MRISAMSQIEASVAASSLVQQPTAQPALYSATCEALERGSERIARPRPLTTQQAECDDRLQASGAKSAHRRAAALFASDDPALAAAYLLAENRSGCSKRLFRVTMPSPTRHPMALVDIACHASPECFGALAKEYWVPSLEWRCWEYVDDRFTVLCEVPWPESAMLAGARFRYGCDRATAKQLCP